VCISSIVATMLEIQKGSTLSRGTMITSMQCARPALKKGRCILPATTVVLVSKTPRVLRICATISSSLRQRPTVPTGEGMRGHFLPKVPKRGAPFQDERETLDSLLMLVTDEMYHRQRVESLHLKSTTSLTSIGLTSRSCVRL